jgi:hypothetical protein
MDRFFLDIAEEEDPPHSPARYLYRRPIDRRIPPMLTMFAKLLISSAGDGKTITGIINASVPLDLHDNQSNMRYSQGWYANPHK